MVVADQRDKRLQGFDIGLSDDLGALGGVAHHRDPIGFVQWAGPLQDPVGDTDLADVVQERGQFDRLRLFNRQVEGIGNAPGQFAHPLGVAVGVGILGIDHRRQGANHAEVEIAVAADEVHRADGRRRLAGKDLSDCVLARR